MRSVRARERTTSAARTAGVTVTPRLLVGPTVAPTLALLVALVTTVAGGGCGAPVEAPPGEPAAPAIPATDAEIRQDMSRMAIQFLAVREMDPFPHALPVAEAYGWQDEFVDLLRPRLGEVAGYKTGGHDAGPPNPMFPTGGVRGVLLEGMIHPSGTAVRPDDTVWGFLEADLALRVGDAAINSAESDLELLAALDAVVPFAEIPDPAFVGNRRSPTSTIVTNMASRLVFVGDPVPLEPSPETIETLNTFGFAVHDERGIEVGAGTMAEMYEPLRAVRWLRDQLRATGKTLAPGHLLSLGNIGITSPLKDGSPRGGPAYPGEAFTLSYYGLAADGPATVTIRIER